MKSAKIELLTKVIAWRILSMTCGFAISYFVTGNAPQAVGIALIVGPVLMFVQWLFEMVWDKYIRERLRNVISRKQG